MPDAVELMKTIKRAALDAVKASKPVEVCFGKVTSASPLKILVEQKLPLGEGQLILTRNVTNFKTYITGGNVKTIITRETTQTGEQPRLFLLMFTLSERFKSPYIMGWLSVMK